MYVLINLVIIIVGLVLGLVFLFVPVPKRAGLKNYKNSLITVAIAYFVIAALNSLLLLSGTGQPEVEYFSFINLLISSSQALLFTFALITLINPKFASFKRVVLHLLPLVFFLLLYLISLLIWGDCQFKVLSNFAVCASNPTLLLRFVFVIFFALQLAYFVYLFEREKQRYSELLNDFFADTETLKLEWVNYAFYSAFAIGVLALIFQVFPHPYFEYFFMSMVVVFYSGFAIKYINYNKIYLTIEPAFVESSPSVLLTVERKKSSMAFQSYKSRVLEEKLYLKEGITLEEIARHLAIGRTTLSGLINSEEKVNFNTWINRFRIDDAQKYMHEHPDCSILEVAERSGFSEQSNFSRQFKLITGFSPSAWRKIKTI